MNIDPAQIEKHITKKTTGILAVHVYGTPCDVYAIQKIAKKHIPICVYKHAIASLLTHIDIQWIEYGKIRKRIFSKE